MMPENKPMKMQWLNIDGRQVPSILPNHWNEQKNDWDITGTKSPLPVANYTQNASGVWLPTSKDNPVPTQLTGSNVVEVIPRNIYTNDTPFSIVEAPFNAKGAVITLVVRGVTGSFSEGEGFGLRINSIASTEEYPARNITEYNSGYYTTSERNITHIMYPYSVVNGVKNRAGRCLELSETNMPMPVGVALRINIQGTFGEGEGIDAFCTLKWVY